MDGQYEIDITAFSGGAPIASVQLDGYLGIEEIINWEKILTRDAE